MKPLLVAALALLPFSAFAATYEVGPGYAKTQLKDVVWEQLQPGDIVNIHAKPGGYHELILISQSGTAAQRIVIRGIPDPVTGALPIIDGSSALMDPNFHSYYNSVRGLGVITVSLNNHTAYGISPSYIDIESLDVRNGHMGYTYTDNGTVLNWTQFVAGIYIEHSHFMAIRGCDLHHNALGVFANSKYGGLGTSTENLLVEHNWIHENGNIGSYREHGVYVESLGVIYQYNIIGPQLVGANASGIKDRSSGSVVRYNTFINAGSNYLLMLIDPYYPLQYARPDYRESFVYGNTFYNTEANSSGSIILYGGDQPVYSHYRQGTLYFYNNTVVTTGDSQPFRYTSVFDVPRAVLTGGAPTNEKLDLRNNIFASVPITPEAAAGKLYLMNTDVSGTLNLGINWVSPSVLTTVTPGTVTGTANLIFGDAVGANNPGFLNASMLDFRLASTARSVDATIGAAGALAPAVTSNTLGGDFTPAEEIGPAQSSHPRVPLGGAPDLGAFESDGTVAGAAAGSLGFAYTIYGQVYYENSGTITFTVSRLGGSVGAVDLDYATADGAATGGLDYSVASGTLHWANGDSAPQTFSVTLLPDGLTESQENFTVRLSNATNGAQLGPSIFQDIAIRDGSGGGGANPTGGSLTFNSTTFNASEGAGTALITVNRTGATTGAVSVHYATSNGTATAADYTSASGTLNWPAGSSTPQTFSVAIDDDSLVESNETIVLTLSATTGGAALGNPATATLTINDNDHTPPPPRELIYAVGATTGALIALYSDAPQTPLFSVAITGIAPGEQVRAIDFDPFTSRLYALVMNIGLPVTANHLYTIDPVTGVATIVSTTSFTPLLAHPSTDLGFNPVTGNLIIAVGTGQQNLRLNAAAGKVIATDTPFAYASGDFHAGATPSIVGADFQSLGNNTATYYGIDQTLDVMVRIGSVGGSPISPSRGQLTTLGPLGIDTSGVTGLDFSSTTGAAFACMGGPGATTGDLYYLDTTTGIATLVGQIALAEAVRDIAIAPPYLAWRMKHFGGNIVQPAIAGHNATPANDSITNLTKYAFGMNPNVASPPGLPVAAFAGGHLQLSFTRYAPDVEYEVDVSDDLMNWFTGSTYGIIGTVPSNAATTDVTPVNSPAGWTQVQDNASSQTQTKSFMRLKVLLP